MRNVFDQYEQIENRVTHALGTALHESHKFLEAFCRGVEHPLPLHAKVRVAIQHRPGVHAQLSEEEALRRGLPDLWIDDGADWALVIECKIQHSISLPQLRAHEREARQYENSKVILISPERAPESVSSVFKCILWTEVYEWAKALARDPWAEKLVSYLEVVEKKLVDEEKGLNGALTTFTGIPFSAEEPYSYMEAKRLLRLLMDGLRDRSDLHRVLGVNLRRKGRGSIKGKVSFSVWDMLPLAGDDENFTRAPHLTVGIRSTEAVAQLTIPDRVSQPTRRLLIGADVTDFEAGLNEFVRSVRRVLQRDSGAKPYVEVVQRHWPRGRAAPSTYDAEIVFDPRTIRGDGKIIQQFEWIQAAFDAMQSRKANLQLAVGVRFPYETSSVVGTSTFADTVAEVFSATSTFLSRVGRLPP
ncbi:hypothetical protein JJB11_07555 [Ramlibacter ginsenosidimutans]|uniref:PD-(D/E)XK nuclease family protein n=1 Tax=Ramlibacter ginsenosidimutans TaxID=502333 RepID=A0A934TR51_9BURK|nr:hypothetical protein [Ramlibacter ginsenosidimutans]MBK6005948.1 hypothetical protein [Ramlibacter ginsenosidimutans]